MDTAPTPAGTALRYRVGGMDCAGCAGSIETALKRLGGTLAVRVNHQTGMLVLELDEQTTPRERIEAQVRDLGFEIQSADLAAAPVSEEAVEPAWWEQAELRLLLAIGVLLAAGVVACAI